MNESFMYFVRSLISMYKILYYIHTFFIFLIFFTEVIYREKLYNTP